MAEGEGGSRMGNEIKEYDVVVIGSGAGATIVDSALGHDLRVAWVDKGPLGGTCLNVGCIPSKVLIFPADRVVEIQEARKLGIDAEVKRIDFQAIMERMRRIVAESQKEMREGIRHARNLDFYETEARFAGPYALQVGGERIKGERIYIASGARPLIPPIKGIDQVGYLTNDTVLELDERPESIVIVGGGYIGAEYGHFFAAMGSKVTILQRNDRLVPEEEPEISELLKRKMTERMKVYTHTEVTEVRTGGRAGYLLIGRDVHTGEERQFEAEQVLLAAGRKSNADLLKVENAGIEVDARGYVRVNEYLETNVKNIWAFGDAIGKHMFRHVANREAVVAWHNSVHDRKVEMDYRAVPHAVFSNPQIASVGPTEEQAQAEFDILVGEARYLDVAKGQAMMEKDGFAKAILEKGSGKILGFHIIGPYAPILIQEVVDVMAKGGTPGWVSGGMHIHPAMPELVVAALYNLREPR
jgi:dihydrolipoamide dehydrogenase